jgi:hypothetical protein
MDLTTTVEMVRVDHPSSERAWVKATVHLSEEETRVESMRGELLAVLSPVHLVQGAEPATWQGEGLQITKQAGCKCGGTRELHLAADGIIS